MAHLLHPTSQSSVFGNLWRKELSYSDLDIGSYIPTIWDSLLPSAPWSLGISTLWYLTEW